MSSVVVIGNGMVGHRFCERLSGLDRERRFAVSVLAEEPRAAYDRVHLSELFAGKTAAELAIADSGWYAERSYALHLGERAERIERSAREVISDRGRRVPYDLLVLASGSRPFVPPLRGIEKAGVFVYRTLEDLEKIRDWARGRGRAAVLGGGLLGLEAATAVVHMGLEAHVVELADRLMPRQVDGRGGAFLRAAIEKLGVRVHTSARAEEVLGNGRVSGLRLAEGASLDIDMVIVSAGIQPRDELARAAGLPVGERGGVVVDDRLATSDPYIFAIGEVALHRGSVYGLVGPGYAMADVLARRMVGDDALFEGADLSAKLKLLGVDVASFGDYFADQARPEHVRAVVFEDALRGIYQKLLADAEDDRLLGGILVGDAARFSALQVAARDRRPLPLRPQELLFGAPAASGGTSAADFSDDTQICSCNNVTKGEIARAIAERELTTVGGVKACTRAATGCGGCLTSVSQILEAEVARSGREIVRNLCEHFPYTRQELFWIVKLGRIESFDGLLDSHGQGHGCEVCRPAVASILAATWNDLVFHHATIQDTNDRFLANIQRGGTYSVIPRVPGGEITPEKLSVLGAVARKYDLYCKITGGQRIDLLGARVSRRTTSTTASPTSSRSRTSGIGSCSSGSRPTPCSRSTASCTTSRSWMTTTSATRVRAPSTTARSATRSSRRTATARSERSTT